MTFSRHEVDPEEDQRWLTATNAPAARLVRDLWLTLYKHDGRLPLAWAIEHGPGLPEAWARCGVDAPMRGLLMYLGHPCLTPWSMSCHPECSRQACARCVAAIRAAVPTLDLETVLALAAAARARKEAEPSR